MKTQSNISVFLVDDDEIYITALTHYLKKKFNSIINIQSFATGEECLKKFKRNSDADVVILDYYLNSQSPDAMNGLEVLKKLKETNSETNVVILSAQDKVEIAAESIKNGAYDYVVKSESALIRIQNILKNLFITVEEAKTSKKYEKWNVLMAIVILLMLLIDILYYINR